MASPRPEPPLTRAGFIRSIEAVKDPEQIFRWDARTGIRNRHPHLVCLSSMTGQKSDPAHWWGIAQGIADQVVQHLIDPVYIDCYQWKIGIRCQG